MPEANDVNAPSQPGVSASHRAEPLPRSGRLGLGLFFVYMIFYGGFMLANAFAAEWMAREFTAGLNLAVVSGLALIAMALLLALLYCWLRRMDAEPGDTSRGRPSHGTEVETPENRS